MQLKRRFAAVVIVVFLVFLASFSVLAYVVSLVNNLQEVKARSTQLLADIYRFYYETQSVLTNDFYTTEELRDNLADSVEVLEANLSGLRDMSSRFLEQDGLTTKMNTASRLWDITREEVDEVGAVLDALIATGIERRKGPMNSIYYYHSNMQTTEINNNRDHYYIVQLRNHIDQVLASAVTYNASLDDLTREIKIRADSYTRLSIALSGMLVLGFVVGALLLVFLFGHQALAKQVDRLLREAVTNVEEKRKAQLQALQFQINPHFLDNTIGTIRMMALNNADGDVAKSLRILGRFLRNATSNTSQLVTVREEIGNLKDYISLLQIRYKNRIDVSIEVDEQILDALVPLMLFQPLVENAVLHGLSERLNREDGKGSLTIRGRIVSGTLHFEVLDNGVGMTEGQISEVMAYPSLATTKRGHIGIRNIHDRIAYSFGNGYGLSLHSKAGRYTKVQLSLPVVRNESGDHEPEPRRAL